MRNSIKQWLKSFTHNCIVHPLMQFLPECIGDELHNRNAAWAFSEEKQKD